MSLVDTIPYLNDSAMPSIVEPYTASAVSLSSKGKILVKSQS